MASDPAIPVSPNSLSHRMTSTSPTVRRNRWTSQSLISPRPLMKSRTNDSWGNWGTTGSRENLQMDSSLPQQSYAMCNCGWSPLPMVSCRIWCTPRNRLGTSTFYSIYKRPSEVPSQIIRGWLPVTLHHLQHKRPAEATGRHEISRRLSHYMGDEFQLIQVYDHVNFKIHQPFYLLLSVWCHPPASWWGEIARRSSQQHRH